MNITTHMKLTLLMSFLLIAMTTQAATIRGTVKDGKGESLVGAVVIIESISQQTLSGLDGSYVFSNIPPGEYSITVTFMGYQPGTTQVEITDSNQELAVDISLLPVATELEMVEVTASAEKGSDAEARSIERLSSNTMNIISAKAIALSPDVSVANVIQRVSGLSVERNSNGDPQYAIVRGMDKRYSYTLINGVKIPSPDNKNRYVPLDIFPASLLERLEVYKSLTADQEGDAIGGAMNMVMKSAPMQREVKADLQVGYNRINWLEGFDHYQAGVVSRMSPQEKYGAAYQAQVADFTKKNLEVKSITPLPDLLASASAGRRFIHDRLGLMIGASFQNSYRGTKSLWFDYDTDRFGANLPSLRSLQDRHYSTQQLRGAAHARVDYRISESDQISFYAGYYRLINHEARNIRETYLDGRNYDPLGGDAILSYSTRTKNTDQAILTTTLQGGHQVASFLKMDWSVVRSVATNDQPDNARFVRNGELKDFIEQPQNVERRNARQWLNNSDSDVTAYLDMEIQPSEWKAVSWKIGGLYRERSRDSYFNRYYFDPSPSLQVQGVDWNTFSNVRWSIVNPGGSATDEINYNAYEHITAAYTLTRFNLRRLDVNVGVRMEMTDQGYQLKFPAAGQVPDSTQQYVDWLPSLAAKYIVGDNTNIRLSYYKGLSRPGYFEIVPYQLEDDGYKDVGHPGLKRTKADNIDLRWEYFRNTSDQVLIGVFFKRIQNPIEYAITRIGVNKEPVMQPNNFGVARNMGLEADIMHYFSKFGIRATYTFTYSRITTTKALRTRIDPNDPSSQLTVINVSQTRALQGQANHVANFSVLYKNLPKGWDAQMAFVYTGKRLEAISPFVDNDMYASPIVIVDASVEKRISPRLDVFFKATNLLNAAYQVYIPKPVYQEEGKTIDYPHQDKPGKTLVRRDEYYQSFRAGIRLQL